MLIEVYNFSKKSKKILLRLKENYSAERPIRKFIIELALSGLSR